MGVLPMASPAALDWNCEFDLHQEEPCLGEAVLVSWEKDLLRSSFTRAHTNLMQRADVPQPLFTPRNEKRLWVEIWIPYFQILLWSCEANFVYDNFSGCFSCRITDQKITKAGREILLSTEQIQHPSWFLLPENAQIAPEGAQNIELNSRQVPKDSLDSTHKRSGKPHTQKGKCPHVQLTNIQTAEWCG